MKKLLLTTALIAFYFTWTLAQPCLPEGIEFTTQEQIDSFQINYPGCTDIIGNVQIYGDEITNLNGLSVLAAFGGSLQVGDYVSPPFPPFNGNPGLGDLTGLENVVAVEGNLEIYFNDSLISLNGLNNLVFVGGNLTILGNNSLPNLSGLDNLVSISEHLLIFGNVALTSLTGLGNLSYVFGEFRIGGPFNNNPNPSLTSLSGLDNLNYIGGDFIIRNNDSLSSLLGLNSLTLLGEDLIINSNNILADLTGLENIISIEGVVLIGDYFFGGNPALTSLSGLDNLVSIGRYLEIYNNPLLTDLTGLNSLDSIGQYLKVYENLSLIDLNGLNNLSSINGSCIIKDNESLTSLSGLDNIETGSINDLFIYNNPSLTTCEILSICDYLSIPNGEIEIHDNALGCNSPEEVEEACITGMLELRFDDSFTIYPNPISTTSVIEYTLHQSSPVTIQILDVSGQVVISLLDELQQQGEQRVVYNSDGLKPGIYFCILKTSDGVQTKKLIKL